MNKDLLTTSVSIVIVVVSTLLSIAYVQTHEHKPQAMVNPDQLTCVDLHSVRLDQDGWHRISAADEQIVVHMASGGKAVLKESESLECHEVGKEQRYIITQRWWRAK